LQKRWNTQETWKQLARLRDPRQRFDSGINRRVIIFTALSDGTNQLGRYYWGARWVMGDSIGNCIVSADHMAHARCYTHVFDAWSMHGVSLVAGTRLGYGSHRDMNADCLSLAPPQCHVINENIEDTTQPTKYI
jgi:hypothetical protein